MDLVQKPSYLTKKEAAQKKSDERASWYALVVKIISWSDGLANGGTVSSTNKITPKEWKEYVRGSLEIYKNTNNVKIKKELDETEALIKKHGGFTE